MKKEDKNINKIKYYLEELKDIDSQLNDLFIERISLSEDIYEYIYKNNLENNPITKNIQFLNFNGTSENQDLNDLYQILIKSNRKKYASIKNLYNLEYAKIGKKENKFLEYIFNKFIPNRSSCFNLEENEIINLLERDNFKGYFLNGKYSNAILDKLDGYTYQVEDIKDINLIQKVNGKNYGFNTQYYGFMKFFKKNNIEISGKNIIILKEESSTNSLEYALNKLNANGVDIFSKEEFSNEIYNHQIIISFLNLDKVNYEKMIELSNLPNLETVIDLSEDVFFSKLYIDAINNNIRAYRGFYKDLYENKKSLEIITRKKYSNYIFENILDEFVKDSLNIVLVGMPGAGKTTIGRKLGKIMGRRHIDLDKEFHNEYGISPADYLRNNDEESFRQLEKKVVKKIGSLQNVVISTSGGVVSKIENYYHLKKNSIIFMVERNINHLSTKNRPLSEGGIETLIKMKKDRGLGYQYFTDYTVENRGNFDKVAYIIEEKFNNLDILK